MPIRVSRRELRDERAYPVSSGASHTFQFARPALHVIELEDLHFHLDSAVLLPDERVGGAPEAAPGEPTWAGLAALATCLRHARREPGQRLLIAGHTDTSGPADYNLPLSRLRAKAVHALLAGHRDDWIAVCTERSKVQDYQQILRWVSAALGWPCDPGPADGVHGPNTTTGVRNFQDHYSHRWDDDDKGSATIPVTGAMSRETWGAIYDVYSDALEQILEIDSAAELASYRGAIRWLAEGTPRVGCGESWPIAAPERSNYRSATNRRVELLFFEADHEPALPLACHPAETQCDPAQCEIYWRYERLPIPVEPFTGAQPANGVRLDALSPWFLPGAESCDIGYTLRGPQARADQLQLEVYASNYCALDDWNSGLPRFRALADGKVVSRALEGPLAAERATQTLTDWMGATTCAQGILAKGAGEPDRFVNVACSPYTVLLRYFKDPADAQARLELPPFWPAFDAAGVPVAASLSLRWAVRGTGRLTTGRLLVWDRDGQVVFTRDLVADELTEGEHSFAWDGVASDGSAVTAASMPLRLQVRAHARRGEASGLSLAAAHTEVRLYVAPATLAPAIDPYGATADAASLSLGLAEVFHKDADPARAADGTLWTKHALAQAGFHPGPVSDAAANADYTAALKRAAAAPFTRLALSGSDDADTKDALEGLAAERRRPWFGSASDRSDLDPASDAFKADLRDPAKTLVVWVDDRNWYTDPAWLNPPVDDVTPTIRSLVRAHPTALGDHRGPYTWRDDRVTQDALDVARPWIPLQADLRVLKKDQRLGDVLDGAPVAAELAAMRAAIGPLRIDWSFDEIDGDTISVPEIDRTQYHRERTRTRAALEWALDNLKTAGYARKDVHRSATYFNCPEANGGIRPAAAGDYYKAPFGRGDASLLPWRTSDDASRETILTVVHDRLGQPAEHVHAARRLGRSGIYFHPSRMAGDGYRVRAQVWFAAHADWTFANAGVLAARYPLAPQAHTAGLRLWRKTAIRGYVQWGAPSSHWPGTRAGMLTQHAASHVHLVNDLGAADAAVAVEFGTLWGSTPADAAAFRAIVKSCIHGAADPRAQDANIDFSAAGIWPWHNHANLGILDPVQPRLDANLRNDVFKGIQDQASNLWFKLTNRYAIEIAASLERRLGRMRGHVVVEFKATGDFWGREYRCDHCGRVYYYCTIDSVTITHENAACPSGCGGHLHATATAPQGYGGQLPVPSLGDPIGVSYNFDGTARLWTHELSHNRYYEHCANAPGAYDPHHDHVNNPDPVVSADAFARPPAPDGDGTNAARQWDRCCTMTYVTHLSSYDAVKDQAFFCFRCVLKNRGWKLAGVASPPAGVTEP
jgi:hypothetical protein